jgi:tetratricopeptide (TPR) repeat protein
MPERFVSSEEYDEQAHKLYSDGNYDGALQVLKEGLSLYPNAIDLNVGLGYARLAREEYAWARRAFERASALDDSNEDALVGLGETLLRFGERQEALALFEQVARAGYDHDTELMLTMGRALYRAALYTECRDIFAHASAARPDSGDAAALRVESCPVECSAHCEHKFGVMIITSSRYLLEQGKCFLTLSKTKKTLAQTY